MREIRVFVETDIQVGSLLELPEGPSRHVTQVLRLSLDDALVVFNGDGHDYSATLVETGRRSARIRIERPSDPEPEPLLDIHLAIGISRGERMDFALQKAVELGVHRLTPLFTERSQIRLDGSRLERRQEHWRGVVIAACEQSGRRRLPVLEGARSFEDWLSPPEASGWLLDPEAPRSLVDMPPPAGNVTLLIGPEGGLGPSERTRALETGYLGVRLGPRILRTETAPLAAISAIQALWGDFRGCP